MSPRPLRRLPNLNPRAMRTPTTQPSSIKARNTAPRGPATRPHGFLDWHWGSICRCQAACVRSRHQ
eukprot:84743-Pyramimonas_sp.AAC.1